MVFRLVCSQNISEVGRLFLKDFGVGLLLSQRISYQLCVLGPFLSSTTKEDFFIFCIGEVVNHGLGVWQVFCACPCPYLFHVLANAFVLCGGGIYATVVLRVGSVSE